MDLSVCIIAKNEEKNIGACLESLAPLGCEIVVVDTGSMDRTREVAARYTDRIFDFAWRDDFAAAKNFALQKATYPYVLFMDCDETLEPMTQTDIDVMLEQARRHPCGVGRVRIMNVFHQDGLLQETTEWLTRIFDRRKFHYEGAIHEQVVAIDGRPCETYRTNVNIRHTGYDLTDDERSAKAARNIALLERELERLRGESTDAACQNPVSTDGQQGENSVGQTAQDGGRDGSPASQTEQAVIDELPYVIYQLGKAYYMAGDYDKASGYFAEGLSFDLDPRLEYVIDMVETYGYALINSGRAEEALGLTDEDIYREFGKSADFLFMIGLAYMRCGMFDEAVREFGKATRLDSCRMKGVNSYMANYNIGVVQECRGNLAAAREAYAKCGDYAPAVRRLAGRE